MRVTTKVNDAILVFKLGKTTNAKISAGKDKILQVYSFSDAQLNYVADSVKQGEKISPKKFFDLADSVCFDCPFRAYLKCYTHKYQQYAGFLSMLKSIAREFKNVNEIPSIHLLEKKIVEISNDKYIRFGTYGEPTLIPFNLVSNMVQACRAMIDWQRRARKYRTASSGRQVTDGRGLKMEAGNKQVAASK